VRTFSKTGTYWWRVAGGILIPGPTVVRNDYAVNPVFVDDRLTPTAFSIGIDQSRQPIFASTALRFPVLRASAAQVSGKWSRMWRDLIPEPIFGLGFPWIEGNFGAQSMLAGGSWPIWEIGRAHV